METHPTPPKNNLHILQQKWPKCIQFTFMTNTAKKQTSLPTDMHTMQQAQPVSKLVFYAQSTSAVISGRAGTAKWGKTLYILKIKYMWNTMYSP